MDAREKVGQWIDGGRGALERDADGALVFVARSADVDAHVIRLRRAYDWLSRDALWSPVTDLQFGELERVGSKGVEAFVGRGEGYSSFHLLPLLTLVTGRSALLAGSPGRGKSTMATLMGVIGGMAPETVSRRIIRGHPQLTVADLLGGPLPKDLLDADDAGAVVVRWRKWLFEPVRIVDEYNRIPTKTQSALLSILAEGVAEMYEQEATVPPGAFFLTANDAHGGGTFAVIEALRDRIDVVVRSPALHPTHIDRLTTSREPPHLRVPDDVRLAPDAIAALAQAARRLPIQPDALRGLQSFVASLEFCRRASEDITRMNKDVLHLAGKRVADVCHEDCPLDKEVHLCTQTERGVSVRAIAAVLDFARALALFRRQRVVRLEDIRAVLPFVLVDRLSPNLASPFFVGPERDRLLNDREGWIANLFERSLHQLALYGAYHDDTLEQVKAAEQATDVATARRALTNLKRTMAAAIDHRELCAPVHSDLVLLQGAHASLQRRLRQQPADAAGDGAIGAGASKS